MDLDSTQKYNDETSQQCQLPGNTRNLQDDSDRYWCNDLHFEIHGVCGVSHEKSETKGRVL